MQNLSSDIVVNQLLKYRSKVLGEVLKNRFEYSTAFEKINSLFGAGVKVTNFELVNKSEFTVSAQTTGKENVNGIEDKVAEINLGEVEGVTKAVINGATHTNDDQWLVQMEVYLK